MEYSDGYPYENPEYIRNFRLILDAIKHKYQIQISITKLIEKSRKEDDESMNYKNLEVSYEDIVAFYKEKGQKSSSFPITQRFLENNKPTENEEYIKLARVMTCKDYEYCWKKITKIKQNENFVFKAIFEHKMYLKLYI